LILQFVSQKRAGKYLPDLFHLLAVQKYFENETSPSSKGKITIVFVENYSQWDIFENDFKNAFIINPNPSS